MDTSSNGSGDVRRISVLCVDDDPVLLRTLAMLLEREGFVVATATNSSQALEVVARTPIDVVLIDHSVCDRERSCLREMLMQAQPAIRFMLHSGCPEVVECVGTVPVLPKPVSPPVLVQTLREMVQKS